MASKDGEDNVTAEMITHLLNEWHGGRKEAINKIFPFFHKYLRMMAHKCLRTESTKDLETGDLVNELYLRLREYTPIKIERFTDRRQFIPLATSVAKNILIDFARNRKTEKRGGHLKKIPLDEPDLRELRVFGAQLNELCDALEELRNVDAFAYEIVFCKYFMGFADGLTAKVLGISTRSVERKWAYARSWLHRNLEGEDV